MYTPATLLLLTLLLTLSHGGKVFMGYYAEWAPAETWQPHCGLNVCPLFFTPHLPLHISISLLYLYNVHNTRSTSRSITQHHAASRSITQHYAAPRITTQHYASLRSTTHHYAAPRNTTQHHAAPRSTSYTSSQHINISLFIISYTIIVIS